MASFGAHFIVVGVSLTGPNSAWLWSAISGIALVLTLIAIYRQLRIQRSASAREQVTEIRRDFASELMARRRLSTIEALLLDEPITRFTPSIWEVCDFWENIGGLAKRGHLNKKVLYNMMGANAVLWWQVLGPVCRDTRLKHSMPDFFETFEWLALDVHRQNKKSGTVADSSMTITPEFLNEMCALLRAEVAFHESLRK